MKIRILFREARHLIREHRLYFLAPVLISLLLFAILFFKIGPALVLSLIYTGI